MSCPNQFVVSSKYHLSQRKTKPARRLSRTAKTQISMRIRSVWSESLLIACDFYSLRAIQREINENPCHNRWISRLIWVFAGHTGLIVGLVVRWLIYKPKVLLTLVLLNPDILCFYKQCLFDLGLTSLSTIFQSYRDGLWMWQGAQ